MRADTVIRQEGMKAIFDRLNPVEGERFIYLLLSEPFDYTEWQRGLFEDMSLEEFSQKAMDYWVREREGRTNLQEHII